MEMCEVLTLSGAENCDHSLSIKAQASHYARTQHVTVDSYKCKYSCSLCSVWICM